MVLGDKKVVDLGVCVGLLRGCCGHLAETRSGLG